MKLYTVSMKRAIAKCHQEDAPELSLPPFRSSYRFVNTMINQGNDMEMLKNMMFAMSMAMNQDNSEYSYVQPYSTNSGRSDNLMDKMRMMMRRMKMKDMMRSNYQNDYDMSEFFNDRMDNYRTNNAMSQFKQMFNSYRSKRQASRRQGPRPAPRQTGDNLDLQGMKRDAQKYTMPSPWFGQKYEQILDTCYEMATNLPAEINNHSTVSGSFGKVKLGEI